MSAPVRRGRRVRELLALTRIRFALVLREPEVLFWAFGFPVVLAMVLGLAFRNPTLEPVRVAVIEGSSIAATLEHIDGLLLRRIDPEDADRVLAGAAVDLVVLPGDPPVLRYDPERLEADRARLAVESAFAAASGVVAPELRHEARITEGGRYVDWLLPGLIGMNLMSTGVWGVGFAMVDMRQRKFLKRFRVTPMSRSTFLLAEMLARLSLLVASLVLLTLFGQWILGVPQLGSWLLLCVFFVVGGLCFSGMGLLIASRARTVEAVSGMMNLALVPMWLCSGIFYSYERFPEVVHLPIRALPLTTLIDGLRLVMLEGAGLAEVWWVLAITGGWAAAFFLLAARLFRWT